MSKSLQLLHITDPHLCAAADARLHGWHVMDAFEAVLAQALARHPRFDALVLGGDLVDDESRAGYARLDRRLAALKRPVLAMAGNHDDPALMAATLDHASVHGCLELGDWRLYALDSHVEGRESGCVGAEQRARLDQQLRADPRPSVVFVHHPPCPLDSAWIDAIGLLDAQALRQLLACHSQVRAVVCGHAHQSAHRALGAIDCWITPATMRQFRPGSPDFAEDREQAPGYRLLELQPGGRVDTRTVRVEEARAACG